MGQPRIGVLADTSASAGPASWLALRVLRVELERRLPGVQLEVLAREPLSSPLDGGEPPGEAGDWSPQRRAELAARWDCVAVLAGDPEDDPVGAAVAVEPGDLAGAAEPDASDQDQPGTWPPLDGLGSEHEVACPSITLDPDTLCVLTPRVFDRAVLERRLAWLRLVGLCPPEGARRPSLPSPLSLEDVVALDLVPSVGQGTESERATRQSWALTLLDALVSTAISRHPPPPSAPPSAPPDGLAQVARAARARQHRRYRIVMAEQAGADALYRAELESRLAELRQGASQSYTRWEDERSARAAELDAKQAELDAKQAELARVSSQLGGLEAGLAALQRELDATHATRLFRYTAGARHLYGALRRWRA